MGFQMGERWVSGMMGGWANEQMALKLYACPRPEGSLGPQSIRSLLPPSVAPKAHGSHPKLFSHMTPLRLSLPPHSVRHFCPLPPPFHPSHLNHSTALPAPLHWSEGRELTHLPVGASQISETGGRVGMRGDGLPLGDEGTPSFAWGSHPPARHPILAPTARRAGFFPHHGCGLCLLCGEPLPAARSRIDSGRAGGGAERERGREGERGERKPQ